MNFWDELFGNNKPIIGLSPMDGVTDAPMRYMSAKYGQPDVLITEFVSVDALHFATGERRARLLKTFIKARDVGELAHKPYEIAQVLGHTIDYFKEAAELVESLGFDGIDINMGCPAHKVEEHGSGAGLIRTPKLAQEIVLAVKSATRLPVSVKTRIGVDHDVSEEWMETLMEVHPANISLHGRTLRQLYQGRADWEAIGRAAEIVHKHGGHILGNGDVTSMQQAAYCVQQYRVDGVLIGRAAEGNPGIFNDHYNIKPLDHWNLSIEQRKAWMVEHSKIFEQVFGVGNFMPMRKHLAWYCKGFPGASELRSKLMLTNSASEVEEIVGNIV
jgi:nifR3 family TIM-barrel protein